MAYDERQIRQEAHRIWETEGRPEGGGRALAPGGGKSNGKSEASSPRLSSMAAKLEGLGQKPATESVSGVQQAPPAPRTPTFSP
jgi:hypothetical protein